MRMRAGFEAWWRRTHKARTLGDGWLERDDLWGKGGYAQPSVHFEWLAFKAGHRAGRKP